MCSVANFYYEYYLANYLAFSNMQETESLYSFLFNWDRKDEVICAKFQRKSIPNWTLNISPVLNSKRLSITG